jgi:hypothetical protein
MRKNFISSYAKNIIKWNEPLDIYSTKVLLHKNKTIEKGSKFDLLIDVIDLKLKSRGF